MSLDAHEIAYYAVRGTDRDPVKDVKEVEEMIENHSTSIVIDLLHKEAKKLEKQAITQEKIGNIHTMHEKMDIARCLRLSANHIEGNN